jgi:hypothetical protein
VGLKNVTITLDERTAARAKRAAARESKSLSRYISDVLQGHLSEAQDYERAMKSWFERKAYFRSETGTVYPTREELYDEAIGIR